VSRTLTTLATLAPLVLLVTLLLNVTPLFAAHTIHHSLKKSPMIEKIIIRGLTRTKEHVVLRELLVKEGDVLTAEVLLDCIQRLKNRRIFSKVLPIIKLTSDNHVELTIEVEERWTAIPYFNFSSGGDTFYLYAGIYDINTFGRYIETGGQYESWNGKSGGSIWFRNPRFLNKRILAGADLSSTLRPRTLYSPSGDIQGNFNLKQKKLKLFFENEIKIWLRLGFTLQLRQTEIIDASATDKIDSLTLDLLNNGKITDEIGTTFYATLGRLNYDNYLVSGRESSLFYRYAGDKTGSGELIKQVSWENSIFWRLPHTANAGFRFNISAIDTDNIQNFFYIGGFNNIRGYFDGQFRSKAYWQLNAEYRIPSLKTDWLVIQHIFFVDAVNTSNQLKDLGNSNNIVYSGGTGIRVISPKIYSLNGRIDFALISSQKTQSVISFGAQQFF